MWMNGVCPVMVTPMNEKGRPDVEGVHRLINLFLENDVAGVWMLGSASEEIHISREDRVLLVREVCSAVKGRIPVITGTGLADTREILNFIEQVADAGVSAVHALYHDHKQSEALMIKSMTGLAERSPVPIWLYQNRNRGRQLTPRIVKELSVHPNIGGVKIGGFAVRDLVNAARLQTPTFQVVGAGGAGQCYVMLCLGSTSHTASDASCWPEEYKKLFELFRSGDLEGARTQQFRMVQLIKEIGDSAKSENGEFSAEEKFILSVRGVCNEYVNPSYRLLNDTEKERVKRSLRSYGFSWAQEAVGTAS